MGRFYLGDLYDISWFIICPNIRIHFLHLVILDGKKVQGAGAKGESRTVVLSESALLIFEPEKPSDTAEQYAVLLFWADLFSLKEVRRTASAPQEVTLCWEEPETGRGHREKLVMKDAECFIKKLVANMDELGAAVRTNKFDRVTKSIPTKEEVNSMLGMIPEMETLYAENASKETRKELRSVYKKIEEYCVLRGDKQAGEWRLKAELLSERNALPFNPS